MSITDELREWAKTLTNWWYDPVKDEYTYTTGTMLPSIDAVRLDSNIIAIADRIDAEHQKALDEWKAKQGQMWLKGYSECHAELLEGNETLASDLERCGWIRLPKDADGEYIHAVDVLDGYGKTIEVVELRHGRSGWVIISRDGNGYADTFAFTHHAPTVEDVLREFAEKITDSQIPGVHPTYEEAIAEYASKLRLAGSDAE